MINPACPRKASNCCLHWFVRSSLQALSACQSEKATPAHRLEAINLQSLKAAEIASPWMMPGG